MSSGLVVAVDGKSVDEEQQFSGDRPRFQVATDRDPPHLDIFDIAGTALVTNAGNGFFAEETLGTIRHGLGYKPRVFVYFYVYSNQSYAVGKYFYAFGTADDYVGYETDTNNLYIKHILDDTSLNSGVTSTAPSVGKIRVKYMICSNPVNAVTNEALAAT